MDTTRYHIYDFKRVQTNRPLELCPHRVLPHTPKIILRSGGFSTSLVCPIVIYSTAAKPNSSVVANATSSHTCRHTNSLPIVVSNTLMNVPSVVPANSKPSRKLAIFCVSIWNAMSAAPSDSMKKVSSQSDKVPKYES